MARTRLLSKQQLRWLDKEAVGYREATLTNLSESCRPAGVILSCVCLCHRAASFTYFGEVLRCPHKRIVTITKVYIARNTIHEEIIRFQKISALCLHCNNSHLSEARIFTRLVANKLESNVYISLGCEVMECIACIYQGD